MVSSAIRSSAALLLLAAIAAASPAKDEFWKRAEMRAVDCTGDDPIACLKHRVMSFVEEMLSKNAYQVSQDVEVLRNNYRSNEVVGRGEQSIEDKVAEYIETHDVKFKLPMGGASVTVDSTNLANDEMTFRLKLSEHANGPVEGRKNKLKKIIVPIMVFILLKAMTLIPLALGILGLKAWNALQLSFFSFVISVGMAIFQLCKKIAADSAHPQIAAHGWDAAAYSSHYAARSLSSGDSAPQMAYSAQRPN